MSQMLSVEDVAFSVGVSNQAVRSMLSRCDVQHIQQRGRTRLYDIADVVKCYPALNAMLRTAGVREVEKDDDRKPRADFGALRKHSAELTAIATRYALEFYLDAAMPDCYGACELAVRRVHDEYARGYHREIATPGQVSRLTTNWLYKARIKRRDNEKSATKQKYIGDYWTGGWQQLHMRKWKQHTAALSAATVRYDIPAIMESSGNAGPGFGFGKLIMLDDRSADSWSDAGEEYTLPTAVYVWDILTGALLWVETSETISAQTYIRAILSTAYAWGFAEMPLFFMENAKASTARRVIGTVKSLYTAEELQMMEEGRDELRRKLAHGCTEPVAYNLPHIPRHVGKAAGERRFGLLKREYDSRRHAMTFQGGNRNESVQLHVNNQHWVLVSSPNRPGFALDKMAIPAKQRYFDELMQFAYSDYANRPRRSLQLWAKQRGTEPTIAAAVAYYYTPELMRKPTLEQLAYLLYFAQTKLYRQVTCRASGHLQCTIEGRTINLTSSAITHRHVGRKMAVVPVPGQSGEYMVYIADDIQNPTWVCQASDRTATTLDDAATMRAEVRYEREETARREWQEIAAVRQSQTTTTAQYMPLPNAPKFMGEIDGNAADEAQVESGEAHSEVIEVRSEDVLHVDARPITPTETGTVSEATLRALE